MIFYSNKKVYYNCFNFLMTDYGYYIDSKDVEKELRFSKFVLLHDVYPKITIEIYRSCLGISLEIENSERWSLGSLYKFLHHDKIVRDDFSSVSKIKQYFEKTTREYFDDVLKNLKSLTNDALHSFYKEFPPSVFQWI